MVNLARIKVVLRGRIVNVSLRNSVEFANTHFEHGERLLADQPKDLASALTQLVSALSGKMPQFEISGQVVVPIDGKSQPIEVRMLRYDDESLDFALTHADYAIEIRRRADVTAMAMPIHKTVFIGRGPVAAAESLKPLAIADRLISKQSSFGTVSDQELNHWNEVLAVMQRIGDVDENGVAAW